MDVLQLACRSLVAISARSIASVESEVDLVQFRALIVIDSRRSMSLGELAAASRMHLSTASRLCDRLVAGGLVDRNEDPQNRRQVVLTLTRAGTDLVARVLEERRAALTPMLTALSAAEQTRFIHLLKRFAAAGPEPAETDLWSMGWSTRAPAEE